MSALDRIKFDGPPEVLVWKWPSDAITLGAQLIVNESQEALFYKGGQALDLFDPGTHTLTTANLPFVRKLINLPFGGNTPFSAEVYFVSKAVALAQDWGTKTPFMILDTKYRVSIPMRAYGQYALRVTNSREFVTQIAGAAGGATRSSAAHDAASKAFTAQVAPVSVGNVSRTISTNASDIARNLLESLIIGSVQQSIGERMRDGMSVLEIPNHLIDVSHRTRELLGANYQTFGVELVNFVLESVNFDPNDDGVKQLRSMLNEGARLDYVGGAFRRNQDFYKSERQFDVLDSAAASGGVGPVMGAAVGVGMGFGAASSAGNLARESMSPVKPSAACARCGSPLEPRARFCGDCGEATPAITVSCSNCSAHNPPNARFCSNCGGRLEPGSCSHCGSALAAGAKFCSGCGEKV